MVFLLGSSAPCTVPAVTVKFSFDTVMKITKAALSVSEKIYGFVVDGQNGAFEGGRQNSMYENISECTSDKEFCQHILPF